MSFTQHRPAGRHRSQRSRATRPGPRPGLRPLLSLAGLGLAFTGLLAVVAVVRGAGPGDGDDTASFASALGSEAAAGGDALVLGAELPPPGSAGPGADGGAGVRAEVLRLQGERVCFTLAWTGMAPPGDARITSDGTGETGPFTVELFAGELPANLTGVTGCVRPPRPQVAALGSTEVTHELVLRAGEPGGASTRGRLRGLDRATDLFQAAVGPLQAQADGAQETGEPGDPDGRATGHVDMVVDRADFVVTWSGLAPPTMGHLHVGRKGQRAGGIVAPLFAAAGGLPPSLTGVAGSVGDLDWYALAAVRKRPREYFLRLHNRDFPDGAVRGQLGRAAGSFGTPE
jgi:hypothetical protein